MTIFMYGYPWIIHGQTILKWTTLERKNVFLATYLPLFINRYATKVGANRTRPTLIISRHTSSRLSTCSALRLFIFSYFDVHVMTLACHLFVKWWRCVIVRWEVPGQLWGVPRSEILYNYRNRSNS